MTTWAIAIYRGVVYPHPRTSTRAHTPSTHACARDASRPLLRGSRHLPYISLGRIATPRPTASRPVEPFARRFAVPHSITSACSISSTWVRRAHARKHRASVRASTSAMSMNRSWCTVPAAQVFKRRAGLVLPCVYCPQYASTCRLEVRRHPPTACRPPLAACPPPLNTAHCQPPPAFHHRPFPALPSAAGLPLIVGRLPYTHVGRMAIPRPKASRPV